MSSVKFFQFCCTFEMFHNRTLGGRTTLCSSSWPLISGVVEDRLSLPRSTEEKVIVPAGEGWRPGSG